MQVIHEGGIWGAVQEYYLIEQGPWQPTRECGIRLIQATESPSAISIVMCKASDQTDI